MPSCRLMLIGFALMVLWSFAVSAARANSPMATLSFAGDRTFGTVNGDNSSVRFPAVYRRSGVMDYPFALVKRYFDNSDLSVVNFECTLTRASYIADKQWYFKGDAGFASIFPSGGIGAVSLANNQSFDDSQPGIDATVSNV